MSTERSRPVDHTVISNAIAQYQAEGRWLTLARLLVAAAGVSWFGLLIWALPSLAGLTAVDGGSAITLTVVFCLAAASFTVASWVVWRPLAQDESFAAFMRLLSGGRKSVRTQSQFESRLASQCRRARTKKGESFTLVVVRAPKKAQDARKDSALRTHPGLAALLVRSAAREDDVVAVALPYEVWLLARGDADALRHSVIQRLTRALDQLDSVTPCQLGVAAFDDSDTTPAQIFEAAYRSMRDIADRDHSSRAA